MSTDLVSWLRSQLAAEQSRLEALSDPQSVPQAVWYTGELEDGAVLAVENLGGPKPFQRWWMDVDVTEWSHHAHSSSLRLFSIDEINERLRTVAAHRAILALHVTEEDAEAEDGARYVLRWCALCNEPDSCVTLRHLASIYESRPGSDPSWRPE